MSDMDQTQSKRFCVIAVDYEYHVPRSHDKHIVNSTSIRRGLESLQNQTFKDFNVVICHDGPKAVSYEEEDIHFNEMGLTPYILNTEVRMDRWGHPSRDVAMRYAYENNLGDYYIQFNIDNEFFPNAFEILNDKINQSDNQVFVFPIHHWKSASGNVFGGVPPHLYNIDCMQLVAHKDIWQSVGMWYNIEEVSDGIIYQDICQRFPWTQVEECLGHNF
jgi:hypothetical protein